MGAIAKTCGWSDARRAELSVLSDRLLFGVKEDATAIARLRARGLGRALARRLVDGGFDTPQALRDAGREEVRAVLKHQGVLAALWEVLEPESPTPMIEYAIPAAAEPLQAAEPAAAPPTRKGRPKKDPAGKSEEAVPDSTPSPSREAQLIVDLRNHLVTYRGHIIPTKPPVNLQGFGFLALAVLASRSGELVSMDDLAAGMLSLSKIPAYGIAPEARNVRYRILHPMKKALPGVVDDQELEGLLDTYKGVGMRLTAPAKVVAA